MKKSNKNEKIDLNFASLCSASKQKLLNRSEAKNFKQKKQNKAKKCEKMLKIAKKGKKANKKRTNRLEFRFALFCFEAKITQVKRSEKFEAKISKNKRKEAKKDK